MRPPLRLRRVAATAALVLAALLAGCGDGMVAGVGSGGSGVAEGTLNGFGSVIVDGVEYSEASLSAGQRALLRLGQRVRLVFGPDDVLRSIELRPQLRGPVTAAQDDSGWLRIAGQWVRVVGSTEDSTRSGITLLEGFGDDRIADGQDAVAYGSWAWDASKHAFVLIATRIEALAAPADPVLLGGVALDVAGNGLRLNEADGTVVRAARLPALAESAVVQLPVPRAQLAVQQGLVAAVQAAAVEDASLGALDLSGFGTVRLGGLASTYDGDSGRVSIQGTQLRGGPTAGMQPGFGAGQFVRITADGSLNTLALQPRTRSPVGAPGDDGTGAVIQLKGRLDGIDWKAPAVRFVLRGVPVIAEAAHIADGCRAATAGQTLYVEVAGYAPSPSAPVRANAVGCTSDLAAADDV